MTGALLLLLALVAAPSAPPSISPFEARELAQGVHLLATPEDYTGPLIGNVSIIEQRDGMVLVDSGGTIARRPPRRRLCALAHRKPVKAVLITHWHGDHPLGIAAIRAAWPHVRIIATPRPAPACSGPSFGYRRRSGPTSATRRWLLNSASGGHRRRPGGATIPTPHEARRSATGSSARVRILALWRDFRGTYLVPPTETFTDQLLIDDPERPVRLMFLGRANTDGDAVAWLPRQRIVISGDIVVIADPVRLRLLSGGLDRACWSGSRRWISLCSCRVMASR